VVLSAGEARCALPAVAREAAALLEISLNGADFVSAGGPFTFSRGVHALALAPSHGPAAGGTRVNVTVDRELASSDGSPRPHRLAALPRAALPRRAALPPRGLRAACS